MSLLCRILGHHWQPPDSIRFQKATTRAYVHVGDERRIEAVPVTWCCDEVCARCGAETWWPT